MIRRDAVTASAGPKDPAVPKAMAAHYQALVALTDEFCTGHLNAEYAELARRAAAALCRKRQSPVVSGHKATWACAIIYALGQANFLSDKSSTPFMTMQDVCAGFGVSPSTGGNKAKTVRDAIGIKTFDHRWMLPSNMATNSAVWLVQVDGLPTDIRNMPRPVQMQAHEKGLIPYVFADGPDGDGGTREPLLARYDAYRVTARRLQNELAQRLWQESVAPIAVRIGLIDTEADAEGLDYNDLAEAIDLALFARTANGTSAIERYVTEIRDTLSDGERKVADCMGASVFSIFRVDGAHRGAGVDMTDLISGKQLWVVDRGLDATAYAGSELAMRLYKPDEFWITAGVAMQMDRSLWHELETTSPIRQKSLRGLTLDQDTIAESVFRLSVE
jgi:hypothetical protein